jgi:predicted permease
MSPALPELSSISGTFLASMRSVGTAVTLAAVGVYLHRRGFVVGEGKRALALISQQVTFPLFLFTKIIYCNQNWSDLPCPDVRKSLEDVWLLLIWPVYVVMCGVFVGSLVARVTKTPLHQVRAVLAACPFSYSTGLPITLLTVVHANFPETSDLGRINPTLFLSIYLSIYLSIVISHPTMGPGRVVAGSRRR